MLVLSRRTKDVILVGDSIRIQVLDIRGGRVRLGISAPPEVPVHRAEIADRCLNESVQPSGQVIVEHGEVIAPPAAPSK
jgi:carbon storage regulator